MEIQFRNTSFRTLMVESHGIDLTIRTPHLPVSGEIETIAATETVIIKAGFDISIEVTQDKVIFSKL